MVHFGSDYGFLKNTIGNIETKYGLLYEFVMVFFYYLWILRLIMVFMVFLETIII